MENETPCIVALEHETPCSIGCAQDAMVATSDRRIPKPACVHGVGLRSRIAVHPWAMALSLLPPDRTVLTGHTFSPVSKLLAISQQMKWAVVLRKCGIVNYHLRVKENERENSEKVRVRVRERERERERERGMEGKRGGD
jgi:hypothetical protein